MQLVIYFLDKVAGSLHSSPDGEVSVEGPRAAQIAHTVEHHHEETGLVGDDLLRYVAGRMRGYWTAEVVESATPHAEGDQPQQPPANPRDFRQAQVNNQARNYQRQQDNESAARQSQSQPPQEEPAVQERTDQPTVQEKPLRDDPPRRHGRIEDMVRTDLYRLASSWFMHDDRSDALRNAIADELHDAGREKEAALLRRVDAPVMHVAPDDEERRGFITEYRFAPASLPVSWLEGGSGDLFSDEPQGVMREGVLAYKNGRVVIETPEGDLDADAIGGAQLTDSFGRAGGVPELGAMARRAGFNL